MTDVDPIVNYLAAHRQVRGLTQADVGDTAGVSRVTVSMWETGRVDIPLSRLQAYANAVGMRLMPIPVEFLVQ